MHLFVLSRKNPFCNPGAAANRLLGLLQGLIDCGYDITILITGGYYSVDEMTTYKGNGVIGDLKYNYLSKRRNVTIWERRISEYLTGFIDYKILEFRYSNFIEKVNFKGSSIVWIDYDNLSFKIIKQTRKSNSIKYFMELNEYPDIHHHNNSTKYFWQKMLANSTSKLFYQNILPSLDGFALMTKALIRHFEEKIGSRTKVLHLPMTVDISRFNLTLEYPKLENIKAPYIAFVGAMSDSKDGVNFLIEAFAKIANDYPAYSLALFGFWAYDTPIHLKRIKELDLESRIIYSKPISSSEVVNLIMNANLLVLPRPDSYQAQGGFPTKLGEYLATSKPIVATTVGEIPDYLEDGKNVFFAEPGSIESLTRALNKALGDSEIASRIGKEGRIVAEKQFSTKVQAANLNDFFTNII
jgi:glycosyltransferase involved in cell wall biosynthesis